jgi:two-component system sensor histidine kinase DesK
VAWNERRARSLLVAVHAVVIVEAVISTAVGFAGQAGTGTPLVVVTLGLVIFAIQIRHSFAFARRERPRGWPWTTTALALLIYAPLPFFGWGWVYLQGCVMASLAMRVRPQWVVAAIAAPVIGTDIATLAGVDPSVTQLPASGIAFWTVYATLSLLFNFAALYGSAALLRSAGALHNARAELAAMAIEGERLRISRDLHDLLGQSLSAVSLKGELALRLLRSDAAAARAEIESLTELARDALRGLRTVSYDEASPTIHTEASGAASLLSAAGIQTTVELQIGPLAPGPDRVLAWAVREGVANILRHSSARSCSIVAWEGNGTVCLKIRNDGASAPGAPGSGITGIAERARALAGDAHTVQTGNEFELSVAVPRESS